MAVIIESIAFSADDRGVVFEPLQAPAIEQQKNIHTVITAPGRIRGNHYHRHATEVRVVKGPARVRFRDSGEVREVVVGDDDVMRFTFPPGTTHAVENTGDEPQVLVSFSTAPHDPRNPDVVRDELIPPS